MKLVWKGELDSFFFFYAWYTSLFPPTFLPLFFCRSFFLFPVIFPCLRLSLSIFVLLLLVWGRGQLRPKTV